MEGGIDEKLVEIKGFPSAFYSIKLTFTPLFDLIHLQA
jgi:hypothetical protein